jgi:hypothetical protein
MLNAEPATPDEVRHGRFAGRLLIAASLLEELAMAHHPTVGAHDTVAAMREIGRLSALSGTVHGALIALMLASFYCLTEFCLQRGLRRPLVRAGLIAYAAGVIAMIGAAMISGFVVADLAAQVMRTTAIDQQTSAQLLAFCHVLNQNLAKLGVVAMSAGIAFWSIGLLHDRGFARGVGVLGCAIGPLPLAALAFGMLHLDVRGMGAVVLLQALWCVGIGIVIHRRARAGD